MQVRSQCIDDAELRARAAYASPGRHYHDERHLVESLALLEGIEGLTERDRRVLRWAIIWHDSVYDPRRSDNEERSAELAKRELAGCGVSEEDSAEVARLIRLTSGHQVASGDRLGAILVSIDLAILGSDEDRYRSYAAAIRREYAHVSDEAWREGRTDMLEKLLAVDPLYPDPDFRTRFEARARANLNAELRSLRSG